MIIVPQFIVHNMKNNYYSLESWPLQSCLARCWHGGRVGTESECGSGRGHGACADRGPHRRQAAPDSLGSDLKVYHVLLLFCDGNQF